MASDATPPTGKRTRRRQATAGGPAAGGPAVAVAAPPEPPRRRWAERGWWVAVEYGVLARDKFAPRLPRLRQLGRFQELLEPGGAILYRNLFREDQLEAAWEVLTILRPWQERLVCYVRGEELPAKRVVDLLWCAVYLRGERPCHGTQQGKGRPAGCPGSRRVLLGAGDWTRAEPDLRHVWTFAQVGRDGVARFDRAAVAAFLAGGAPPLCPSAPARDPARFAACLDDVEVRALDWPLVAALAPAHAAAIGPEALGREHGLVLREGEEPLAAHAALELRAAGERVVVRPADAPGRASLAKQVRLDASVEQALRGGLRLRAVRLGEGFARVASGGYEVEQRFVLTPRFQLGPADRPEDLEGYELESHPRATPGWDAWAERVAGRLP